MSDCTDAILNQQRKHDELIAKMSETKRNSHKVNRQSTSRAQYILRMFRVFFSCAKQTNKQGALFFVHKMCIHNARCSIELAIKLFSTLIVQFW